MKRMDRRWSFISQEELTAIAANLTPAEYASDWMTNTNDYEFAPQLLGCSMNLQFADGLSLHYDFYDQKFLKWSDDKGQGGTCFYRALEAPGYQDVIFVHHYRDGLLPPTCVELVLDLKTGCCTAVIGRLGARSVNPREVDHTIHFGRIAKLAQKDAQLHSYTTELVGKAIHWDMPAFTRKPPIKHIYLSPKYYGIHMTRDDDSCFMSADPADYVKIRENLYLVTAMEERRSGIQLCFLINTELLEDIVGHFGISAGNEVGQDKPKIVCTVMTGRKGKFVPMETII